jgi:hypothetical protein
MGWVCSKEDEEYIQNFGGETLVKCQLGRLRRGLVDSIKMDCRDRNIL